MASEKPLLILTLGDPAGIGPEVVAKALCLPQVTEKAVFTVAGAPSLLDRAFELCDCRSDVDWIVTDAPPENPTPAQRGHYLYQALKIGIENCLEGKADALVTAPISKAALAAAGYNYPGHTEILGALTNASPVMMLVGGPLRVVPITTHCALCEVADRLTLQSVYDIGSAVHQAMVRDFGIENPRLALTGLNPHAGEGGLFGREEIEVLDPAAKALRKKGLNITDALPADTAYYRAARGEFDAVLSPTHDQALIPLKLVAFDRAVNVTLNLPIIRTSPGHGTAPDIAWKNQADPTSMSEAILLAAKMAVNRKMVKAE